MSITVRLLAAVAACGCLAAFAADKVVMSFDGGFKPNVSMGRAWKISDTTVKATLPVKFRSSSSIELIPGKTYTLSAEVRSTGGANVGGSATKTPCWAGFLQASNADRASIRVSTQLAEVVKGVNGSDIKVIVSGNLAGWEHMAVIPLYVSVNARADNSDLPNNNLIRLRAGGVRKLSDGKWELLFDRPLQQPLPTRTMLGLHFDYKVYDFMPLMNAGTEWTTMKGSVFMNGTKPESVYLAFACFDPNGEVEIRNAKIVENTK